MTTYMVRLVDPTLPPMWLLGWSRSRGHRKLAVYGTAKHGRLPLSWRTRIGAARAAADASSGSLTFEVVAR